MYSLAIFTPFFISQYFFVNSKPATTGNATINGTRREFSEVVPWDPVGLDEEVELLVSFPKGIVLYYINSHSYDKIITERIHAAMDTIEASSCVVFKGMEFKPTEPISPWLHFTNPKNERECQHEPSIGVHGEVEIVIGFECMSDTNLIHTVLHAIGFKDEVSHPHRDQYIRIMWENIQPRYRNLFRLLSEDTTYKVVEYDPMSIMHFHDRAYSVNGGPTIAPRVPGLLIAPSDKLSQLDVMKLRLWFGHECNKRKVGALLDKCKTVFRNSPMALSKRPLHVNSNQSFESVDIDYGQENQQEDYLGQDEDVGQEEFQRDEDSGAVGIDSDDHGGFDINDDDTGGLDKKDDDDQGDLDKKDDDDQGGLDKKDDDDRGGLDKKDDDDQGGLDKKDDDDRGGLDKKDDDDHENDVDVDGEGLRMKKKKVLRTTKKGKPLPFKRANILK